MAIDVRAEQERWETAFLEYWDSWEEAVGYSCDLPKDLEKTLYTWRVNSRVPFIEIVEALEIAFNSTDAVLDNHVNLYFCKVVWNKIRAATERGWNA